MKILLVDDEQDLVSTLSERLEMRGIDADWVTSGESAMERLRGARYDLAVLDMKMPRISGLELRRKMLEIQPDIKFIFVTGHGSVEDFYAATVEEGAECYLVKPVGIDVLVQKITSILGPR